MRSFRNSLGPTLLITCLLTDIQGSRAHADMLAASGILSNEDLSDITISLTQVGDESRLVPSAGR